MDDEPTQSIETNRTITVGSSLTGEIETEGDVDFIAVELVAGTSYQIDLEGSRSGQGSLIDPLLTGIFNESGASVADENDDGGLVTNSRIIFTPSQSGTYYIGASGFDNTNLTDTGTYTLYVEEESLSTRMDPVLLGVTEESGNDLIDGLTASLYYGPEEDGITRLTYSFTDENSTFYEAFDLDDGGPDLTETVIAPSAEAMSHYESGLDFISGITGIEFTQVVETDGFFGNLRLSGNTADSRGEDSTVLGTAAFPSRNLTAGDTYLFESVISSRSLVFVTLHELGHALGLTHFKGTYPAAFEGTEFSLMTPSFTSIFFPEATRADLYPTTYSYADILALRHLYGERADVNEGNTTYSFDVNERYWETIFDLGGRDTLHIQSDGEAVAIDLTPDETFLGGTFIDVGTTVTYFDGNTTLGSREETVFLAPETVIENIILEDGDDLLIANSAGNLVHTGAGDDTVKAAAGNDRVFGEDGHDLLIAGTGNDLLNGGDGNDTLASGRGHDTIYAGPTDIGDDILVGGSGGDILGGGGGNDFIIGGRHSGTVPGVEAETNIMVDGADTLYGGSGNDTLLAGAFDDKNSNGLFDPGEALFVEDTGNVIFTGTGADLAYGANGKDVIGGGEGDDTLYGGAGDDILYGGPQDVADTGLNDILMGGDGADTLYASFGRDSIDGGAGNDLLFGGDGDDTIHGGAGDDEIYNSAGHDNVSGGSGNDTLRSNSGDDTLTGGSGADIFEFSETHGADVITDFNTAEDQLALIDTVTDFNDIESLRASSTEISLGSMNGILIDTGGGTLFIAGLTLSHLSDEFISL